MTATSDAEKIVMVLSRKRLSLTDEKRLQVEMQDALVAAGYAPAREVRLGPNDVVDFMVGRVAIEVKIKGARRAIYRQCERYCQHHKVDVLILATAVAMGMPGDLNGRPIYVLNLGRAWL